MNGDDQAKAAEAEEAAQQEPGMGSALLAVLVILVSTSILAFLIYVVMVTVVPGASRPTKKAAAIEQPAVPTQSPSRIAG